MSKKEVCDCPEKKYGLGDEIRVDMDAVVGNAGGEVATAKVVLDEGDRVMAILKCFAFPEGREVTIPKKAIL